MITNALQSHVDSRKVELERVLMDWLALASNERRAINSIMSIAAPFREMCNFPHSRN